jgi:XTP/dITP diphosphohydrolase
VMGLLVVPVDPDEIDGLTLGEWDALRGCERVLFEDPTHPLFQRLTASGVACDALTAEPDPSREGWAVVAAPSSGRVVELARAGATVTAGAARAPDDLSAAHAAPVARRATASLANLVVVMARLRSPDGCPWDREQTHESLKIHLTEESHEVIEAIDRGLTGDELREELGDLLLQVAFRAQLAADDGRFDVAGVADAIVAKLVHRHPHVFGDVEVAGADDVVANWETIKRAERRREDASGDMPSGLPALVAAYKAQKRAEGGGARIDETQARSRVAAALAGPVDAASVGEALFFLVALARAAGVDPESALRRATAGRRSV